jgi:hypothetical protein
MFQTTNQLKFRWFSFIFTTRIERAIHHDWTNPEEYGSNLGIPNVALSPDIFSVWEEECIFVSPHVSSAPLHLLFSGCTANDNNDGKNM